MSNDVRQQAGNRFEAEFHRPPHWLVLAPGRINLIGEHTDHQQGWVLPAAIDRFLWIAAAPQEEAVISARSERFGPSAPFAARDCPSQAGDWADLLRGVLAGADDALRKRLPGIAMLVGGDLPSGTGMSSSAAVSVAFATLLDSVARHTGTASSNCFASPRQRALAAQLAEHHFLEVPCGLMDPLAVAEGRHGHAIALDCLHLETREVAIVPELGDWIVIESGVTRELRDGDYRVRIAECTDAVRHLEPDGGHLPDETRLRRIADAYLDDPGSLERTTRALPDRLARRVRHVATENARVHEMISALEDQDAARAGALIDASHRSLRDDFQVSTPELDCLTEIARREGALGSRMMGAGFGGSTLNLVPSHLALPWIKRVLTAYRNETGLTAAAHIVTPVDGARELG